jgi:class 3 adenylate cyclase
VERPATRFVKVGEGPIAYQVFGEGPDLVVVPGGPSHLELRWHLPASARFHRTLAERFRVIVLDRRGLGLSARGAAPSTMAEQVDDVVAVMQAAESERAFVYGSLDGGALAILFAVAHPELTSGLVIESCPERLLRSTDYPFGIAPDDFDRFIGLVEDWSIDEMFRWAAPGLQDDEEARRTFVEYATSGAGPAGFAAALRIAAAVDLRGVLDRIAVPTLVLARRDEPFATPAAVHSLATAIPGAVYRLLDHGALSLDERFDEVADEIQFFATGARRSDHETALVAILVADVVSSTERLLESGDARWRRMLDRHDQLVGQAVRDFGGRLVKSTGDGVIATFDHPRSAIRSGLSLRSALLDIGLAVRVGIHFGEVELRGSDIAGLAVHLAARVQSVAGANEIWVTQTVADLMAGSRIAFLERGTHMLKGIPQEWRLLSVVVE